MVSLSCKGVWERLDGVDGLWFVSWDGAQWVLLVERCGRQWASTEGAFLCLSWSPYPPRIWLVLMFDEDLLHLGLSSGQNNSHTRLLLGASRGCGAKLLPALTSKSLWLGSCDLGALYMPSFLFLWALHFPTNFLFWKTRTEEFKLSAVNILARLLCLCTSARVLFWPTYSLPWKLQHMSPIGVRIFSCKTTAQHPTQIQLGCCQPHIWCGLCLPNSFPVWIQDTVKSHALHLVVMLVFI